LDINITGENTGHDPARKRGRREILESIMLDDSIVYEQYAGEGAPSSKKISNEENKDQNYASIVD